LDPLKGGSFGGSTGIAVVCRSLEALRRRLSPGLPLSLKPHGTVGAICRSVRMKRAGLTRLFLTDDQIDVPAKGIGGDLQE
jgi:hypothetical protein